MRSLTDLFKPMIISIGVGMISNNVFYIIYGKRIKALVTDRIYETISPGEPGRYRHELTYKIKGKTYVVWEDIPSGGDNPPGSTKKVWLDPINFNVIKTNILFGIVLSIFVLIVGIPIFYGII